MFSVYQNTWMRWRSRLSCKYSFEEYRIKQYTLQEPMISFKDHVDVQDYNSARRFLVMFLYLNDVQDGGNTNFPKLDTQSRLKCGRMLLFPSTWMFRHAGLLSIDKNIFLELIYTTYELRSHDLSNLLYNEKYARKVIPFLKVDYFTAREYKVVF